MQKPQSFGVFAISGNTIVISSFTIKHFFVTIGEKPKHTTMINVKKQELHTILALFSIITMCIHSYWHGANGLFIFDDIPNLIKLNNYQDFADWDRFWLFLLDGSSGSLGRPLSLASFYLNDNGWPSDPSSFTYTNILIHLINATLVFWVTFKIAHLCGFTSKQQILFSTLSTALWALHPLQTTTVLYIIQRMTELSATFTLIGILFYLYGREVLFKNQKQGFLILFFGVSISLGCAILSKENGALLIAFIWTIELFLFRASDIKQPPNFSYWFIPAITTPLILLIVYLLNQGLRDGAFSLRSFTLEQRLLSEARILFDYLYEIIMPNIQGNGIFHDDYIISKSLLEPWTTLPAVIGWLILITLTIFFRKKYPFATFAIAWFIAGHMIESTFIALELYFEHRNYLPLLGIAIYIAWELTKLFEKNNKAAIAISVSIIAFLSFLTMQNAKLWVNPPALITMWHEYHPQSARAQEAYFALTDDQEKLKSLYSNETSYTLLLNLANKCKSNTISTNDLNSTYTKLNQVKIEYSAVNTLSDFITHWLHGGCPQLSSMDVKAFLNNLVESQHIARHFEFAHQTYYWLSEIHLTEGNLDATMQNLELAYALHPSPQLLTMQAQYLASAGLTQAALDKLNDTKLLQSTLRQRLILRIYQQQFDRLRQTITNMEKSSSQPEFSQEKPHLDTDDPT